MERAHSYDSIIARERNIFGKVSFVSPVVSDDGSAILALTGRTRMPKKSRTRTSQAQKNHRQRTKDYMDALEEEVLRLRAEKDFLQQVATNWERATSALLASEQDTHTHRLHVPSVGPESYAKEAPNTTDAPSPDLEQAIYQQLEGRPHTASFVASFTNLLSELGFKGELAPALLHNFCENIIPTLGMTEAAGTAYVKHLMPLALNSKMVLSSLLAASAGHLQISRIRELATYRFQFRATAFAELQLASSQQNLEPMIPLLALSALLGLLIDDIIAGAGDFLTLLNMAQFWMRLSHHHSHGEEELTTRQFVMEQIHSLKTLAYPIYRVGPTILLTRSPQKDLLMKDPAKLYKVFVSIESATSQACSIHKTIALPAKDDNDLTKANSHSTNALLDKLKATVWDIPAYAPGESSLVWVYFVAASKSVLPLHRSFYTSRLMELLHRIGSDYIKDILMSIQIS